MKERRNRNEAEQDESKGVAVGVIGHGCNQESGDAEEGASIEEAAFPTARVPRGQIFEQDREPENCRGENREAELRRQL